MPHIREEQISAYLDKQLSPEETGALELHLGECEDCRAVLGEMRELTSLFREAERFEPSPFLWNRISAGIAEDRSTAGSWKTVIFSGLHRYGWSRGMAAALCILMFAGIVIIREIKVNNAEQAALAEIDRAYQSLAAQNPDAYNPFSSGHKSDFNANPFRSVRMSGRTDSAPAEAPRHR
jgi:anti-sigma factor RsiW